MKPECAVMRKDILFLGSAFIVALLVRLYFLPFYRVISADGVGYVIAARSLLKGELSPLTTYGVVYPSLTALVSCVGVTTETAGRLVSAVMGSLLVVPLYLLARDLFDRKVGAIACILIIACAPLRAWAGEVMTQATYVTLLLSWYWLLLQAYRRKAFSWAAAAGVVAGLSYLTRPESLVAFAVMAPVLLLPTDDTKTIQQRLILTATCVGAFVLTMMPFLVLVHQVTGHWQLTGKGGVTLADALSEYLGRPDLKNEPGFKGIGFMDVIRSYPGFLWINSQKNLQIALQTILPWYFWVAAVIGFAASDWNRERIVERLYLLASFAPLGIIILFFFVGPEYLQPYLPVMFLWVGNGLSTAEQWLMRPLSGRKELSKYLAVSPLSLILVSVLTLVAFVGQVPADRNKPYHYDDDGGRYDHRRIGEMLKQQLPPGSRIMTRWGRISFYSELENISMPQADLVEMIATAKKSGVKYIIIDGMLMGMRPQFAPLFTPLLNGPTSVVYKPSAGDEQFIPIPGIRLYLLYKDPSSLGVAVYEFIS